MVTIVLQNTSQLLGKNQIVNLYSAPKQVDNAMGLIKFNLIHFCHSSFNAGLFIFAVLRQWCQTENVICTSKELISCNMLYFDS